MKQKISIIVSLVLIVGLLWTGSAFAKEVDQDGYSTALEVVEEPEETDEINPVCEGLFEHPVLLRIAEQYGVSHDVSYDDLMEYFCEYDFGIGEIFLMLETIARSEEDITLQEILEMRTEEELGWGEIWQSLGLIGRGNNGEDSEETETTEAFARNEKRQKFNRQTVNEGEDDELKNGNKAETPPGFDKGNNPNKPANPPGRNKDKGHPGNGNRP